MDVMHCRNVIIIGLCQKIVYILHSHEHVGLESNICSVCDYRSFIRWGCEEAVFNALVCCPYLRTKLLYELSTREIGRPKLHPQHKEDGEPIRSCIQGFENRWDTNLLANITSMRCIHMAIVISHWYLDC